MRIIRSPSLIIRAVLGACESAVGFVLFYSGLIDLSIRLRSRRRLTILFYHEVGDAGRLGAAVVSPRTFARQMRFVAKRYRGVALGDLGGPPAGTRPLPEHPLIVTFDGGYRGNLIHAYPVLKRCGLPFTIYLVTEYIRRQTLPWPFRLRAMIDATERESLSVDFSGRRTTFPLKGARQRAACFSALRGFVGRLDPRDCEACVEEIGRRLAIDLDALPRNLFLTWSEIAELGRDALASFGSHSVTHANLARAADETAVREAVESKREIEERTKKTVDSFCYPGGFFSDRTKSIVRDAGYRTATTTIFGLNGALSDPYELKRIPVYDVPIWIFAMELAGLYRRGAVMGIFDRVKDRVRGKRPSKRTEECA